MKNLIVFAVALLFAGSLMASEYPDISISELKNAIKKGKVTVIDANGTKTFKKNHIPTASSWANDKNIAKVLPKDKDALVVTYCGSPKCTAYMAPANAAKKLGYTNIKRLSAGISGWIKAGEKTEKAK